MAKGVIIHLDNDFKGVLDPSRNLFNQYELDLDYVMCETEHDFDQAITMYKPKIRALIFDLLTKEPSQDEMFDKDAPFLKKVRDGFVCFNIPIFVYSGYLELLGNEFDANGTVFKIDKSEGIQVIFDKLKTLYESGFIEVFCPGGILDNQISKDLHRVFSSQFINNKEIEAVINQIKGNHPFEQTNERIKKVFTRISVRTLLSELLAPEVNEKGEIMEEKVNTIEHYIRRINHNITVWTGDLFKKRGSTDFLFILTPRCNVIRNEQVLVCPFYWKEILKKTDKISKMLNGDPTVSGYDRYLPPSPIFEGGKLSLSKYSIIEKDELLRDYERVISLSNELTNEIIGKFGAHFFRTGITPWDENEVKEQIVANGKA